MIMQNPWIRFIPGKECEAFEYRCGGCGDLSLSFVETDKCQRCGSRDITKGKPGSLVKDSDHGMEGQNEGMGRR